MSSYKFAVVTFEHDFCHGFHSSPRSKSRAILDRRGYKLVFPDIHNKESKNVYEDWYVNPELVDMNYVNNLINQNAKNYENSPFKEIGKSINWQNIKYDF
jgi:hypothetical protein